MEDFSQGVTPDDGGAVMEGWRGQAGRRAGQKTYTGSADMVGLVVCEKWLLRESSRREAEARWMVFG